METFPQPGTLAELKLPADYLAEQPAPIFPSKSSLVWAIRVQRERLAAAGAIVKIAGRIWIKPAAFDAVMLDAGRLAVQGGNHG